MALWPLKELINLKQKKMKRIFYLFSILIAGAIILMYSCTKENKMINEEPGLVDNGPELTPTDIKVNKLIMGFKDKVTFHLENPGLKSTDTISADSVLWFLEATINYAHAFPNEIYEEFEVTEVTLSIAKNGDGNIDMDEVAQKYDEMKAEVAALYHGSEFDDKGLAVVDLKETSQSSTEIVFIAETVTGKKKSDPYPSINGPFEVGDDWWYGDEAGLCIENSDDESDAALELFAFINDEIPDPNGNYFFINHKDYDIWGGDPLLQRDPTPDNHLDYYLFFATTALGPNSCGEDTLCVEYPEMNLYYSYLKTLIFSYLPANVPVLYGKSVEVVVDMKGESEFIDPYIEYKHYLEAIFGEKVGFMAGAEGPTEL